MWMFTVTLLITAKNWKWHKCPSMLSRHTTMVHPYAGISLSGRKEQTPDRHNSTDKSQMWYAKREKPDSETTYHVIPFIWHSGIRKTTGTKTDLWLIARGWGGGRCDSNETGWSCSELCIQIMVVVSPLQLFVKTHSSVNQKVWIAPHNLYHNKTVLLDWFWV